MKVVMILLVAAVAAVTAGCGEGDAEKKARARREQNAAEAAAGAAAAKQRQDGETRFFLVTGGGTWASKVGDFEADGMRSETGLELRENNTFAIRTVTRLRQPPQTTDVRGEGTWALADKQLTLTLQRSLDGRPIPDEQKVMRFRYVRDEAARPDREALVGDGPDGVRFVRGKVAN